MSTPQTERRHSHRVELNKCMQIVLPGGETLAGETLDIGAGGVLIKFRQLPDNLKENQSVKLTLALHDGKISEPYTCTIIRIVRNSLALQLDLDRSAEFAQRVKECMFTRKAEDLENS